jgi:hypothetical protein
MFNRVVTVSWRGRPGPKFWVRMSVYFPDCPRRRRGMAIGSFQCARPGRVNDRDDNLMHTTTSLNDVLLPSRVTAWLVVCFT